VIGRLPRVILWLMTGPLVVAGLGWGLLHVPESNVAMLALSAGLVVALLVLEGLIGAGAILRGAAPAGWVPPAGRMLRAVPAAILALLLYAAVRYAFIALTARYGEVTSQIDAWFIARLDWTATAWLHRAVRWGLWGAGHALAASFALAVLVRATLGAADGSRGLRWLAAALSPVRLAGMAAVLLIFVWLPWQLVAWRPASLPVSIVEPLFAGAKLLGIAAIIHLGLSLLLWLAQRAPAKVSPR
jgi:hypothetical protein